MSSYKISSLNPIRFHQIGVGDFAYNQIPSFEHLRGYNQVYYHGDAPYIQILSEISTATMKMELVDLYGVSVKTWSVGSSGNMYGDWFVFHWINYFPLPAQVAAGIYFLKLTISDSDGVKEFYSEPIRLALTVSDTIKITYTHDLNEFDAYFVCNNTKPFMLRVEGGMKSEGFSPGGKFTMFQDQDYKSVLLQSQPFNVEKYTFGPSEGIPNHVADKINRIFGLSTVKIDGVQYSRNEGAKMERIGEIDYPLAGWSIDLIKTENPYSELFDQNTLSPLTADNTTVTVDSDIITSDQTIY